MAKQLVGEVGGKEKCLSYEVIMRLSLPQSKFLLSLTSLLTGTSFHT